MMMLVSQGIIFICTFDTTISISSFINNHITLYILHLFLYHTLHLTKPSIKKGIYKYLIIRFMII